MDMNEIVFIENDRVLTDSLMVAEVFGKDHNKVMRDIRSQVKKLEEAGEEQFSLSNFGQSDYKNERGKVYQKLLLTEDAFTLVTMSYTTVEAMKFKIKYINEFNRMKSLVGNKNSQFSVPATFAEALRLAADQHEKIEVLTPKAESFDHFISGENYQKMNDVAKSLGVGRNKLFAFLREEEILMKDNTPYQRYINSGYFVVKEIPIKGKSVAFNKTQTYVTAKGVDYIGKRLKGSHLKLVQ
jgi:anti-repressor protein